MAYLTGCQRETLGNHAGQIFLDTLKKGIRNFDTQTAWEAINRTASMRVAHAGRDFLEDWEVLGYCASESNSWSASCTLAYAFDDWAAAEMAREMKEPAELIQMYSKRSLNYRNVWDNHTKFFCPRSKDGSFKCPLDPAFLLDGGEKTGGYVEGDAEQWRWFVPHDVQGLAELFGGRKAMAMALDTFMTNAAKYPGTALPNPFYWAGNEPDILAPWMGSLIGRPDLTAKHTRWLVLLLTSVMLRCSHPNLPVRLSINLTMHGPAALLTMRFHRVLDTYYTAQPQGLPGNDDFGQSPILPRALSAFPS
jgi:putative alpha-1,2-mannosidase